MSVERLTRYICDRAHGAQGVSESKLTGAYCRGQFEDTAVVERLAAIEDILGDTYDLDHLRELVEADNDGRCVALPCKVGQTVYTLFCGEIVEKRIGQIHVNGYTNPQIWADIDCDWSTTQKIRWDVEIGKTVFLIREEAEAALARRTECSD